MLQAYKKVGETPLELLDRLRQEQPDLKKEILSYAGRLDPMAEGEMLILVGKEENQENKNYFGFDKEYTATFLVGMATDTRDALGLITNTKADCTIHSTVIEQDLKNIKKLTEQTYPWFSGMTVDGIKLFDHFKAGRTDIERPVQSISIKKAELISEENMQAEDVYEYIKDTISKVHGDFRQKEILESWESYFEKHKEPLQKFTVRFHVSGGTFIRALTEEFSSPVTLFTLKRTKIHTNLLK